MDAAVSKETYDKAINYYQSENKRLREALEFYANENSYFMIDRFAQAKVNYDGGETARQALVGDSK